LPSLGNTLRRCGRPVVEAVLLAESWYVDAAQSPGALAVAPSHHPDRQQAITLIGRHADHSRETQVVQPFRRDSDRQWVWEKRPLELYNQPVNQPGAAISLLDYLFEPGGGR
jgi:hypothetical protein